MGILSDIGKAVSSVGSFIAPYAPIIGAGVSYLGGKEQNAASAQAAREQMAFQEQMSNTSYQRQVEDLKAAGINPMLVAKLGGASTPAGAMPQFVNPGLAAAQGFSGAGAGLSSSAQARRTDIESDIASEYGMAQAKANLEETLGRVGMNAAQTQHFLKQTELAGEQIKTERERPAQVRAMTEHLVQMAHTEQFRQLNYQQQTALIQAQIPYWSAHARLEMNQVAAEELSGNLRRILAEAGPAGSAVKGVLDAAESYFDRKFGRLNPKNWGRRK